MCGLVRASLAWHIARCTVVIVVVSCLWLRPVDASLASPSIYPSNNTDKVPLRAFSIILSFSEVVQTGVGTIAVTTNIGNIAELDCLSAPKCNNKDVVLPMHSDLLPDAQHRLVIPSTCFLAAASGQAMAAPIDTYRFRTIQRGDSGVTFDVQSPLVYPVVSPQPGKWVDSDVSFELYFSEAVQAGDSSVMLAWSGGAMGEKESRMSIFDAAPQITFDANLPGKVIVRPKPLDTGAEYELVFDNDAFKDVAGNFMPRSEVALPFSPYRVKVSAVATVATFMPTPGATTGVTPSMNIVLRFEDAVIPGTSGEIKLCQDWEPTDESCTNFVTIPISRMFFLGKAVILNPAADLIAQAHYNVSIPSSVINFYSGLDSTASSYSFTVGESTDSDEGGPLLVVAAVDCNGNGVLAGPDGVSDTCDTDDDLVDDFAEVTDTVAANTPMRLSAKFKLYFNERVEVAIGRVATLKMHDSNVDLASVTPSVGPAENDCVVDLSPDLMPGTLYTLSLPAGVITDASSKKNPFSGTSMSFYTPLHARTSSPQHGAEEVSRTTALLVTFVGTPRVGLTTLASPGDLRIVVKDTLYNIERYIPLTDPDQVRFQGNDVLVMPWPPLLAGRPYTVTLPKQSIRYMTREFSFNFSTRAEDQLKPEVLMHFPGSEVLSKANADATPPWVLFSEAVQPATSKESKHINFIEDGVTKYSMNSSDDTCGFGGASTDACAVLGNRKKKLQMYPLGLGGAGATAWASEGKAYTVDIEAGAFSDLPSPGVSFSNSMDSVSFTFQIDQSTTGGSDAPDILSVLGSDPVNAAKRVPLKPEIVFTFTEHVQQGVGGSVKFCLNSNAEVDGTPACDSGLFSDGSDATFDLASSTFEGSMLKMMLHKDLNPSQTLFVLMPQGAVKDASTGLKLSPAIDRSGYYFRVMDVDVVKPFLVYYSTPETLASDVVLFFSEAIQASSGSVGIEEMETGKPISGLTTVISGNTLTISASWEPGAQYKLLPLSDVLKDLAGNNVAGGDMYGGNQYTPAAAPNTTWCGRQLTPNHYQEDSTDASDRWLGRRLLSSNSSDGNSTPIITTESTATTKATNTTTTTTPIDTTNATITTTTIKTAVATTTALITTTNATISIMGDEAEGSNCTCAGVTDSSGKGEECFDSGEGHAKCLVHPGACEKSWPAVEKSGFYWSVLPCSNMSYANSAESALSNDTFMSNLTSDNTTVASTAQSVVTAGEAKEINNCTCAGVTDSFGNGGECFDGGEGYAKCLVYPGVCDTSWPAVEKPGFHWSEIPCSNVSHGNISQSGISDEFDQPGDDMQNVTINVTSNSSGESIAEESETHDSENATADEEEAKPVCDLTSPSFLRMFPAEGTFYLPSTGTILPVVVGLFFSEPVLLNGGLKILDSLEKAVPLEASPYLIETNGVAVPVPADLVVLGGTFKIVVPSGAVVDTAGNALPAMNKSLTSELAPGRELPSSVHFQISADVEAPTASYVPESNTSTIHQYDTVTIQFNEMMQKGKGHIEIKYADSPPAAAATASATAAVGTRVVEIPVSLLPLVSSVSTGNKTSAVIVDIGTRLYPGRKYSLSAPSDAFLDVAGNAFTGLDSPDAYTMMTTLQKDAVGPVLRAADIGGGESPPNAEFAGEPITLYFSEAVQMGSTGSARLVGSSGGNFCSSSAAGSCTMRSGPCSAACNYEPAALSVIPRSLKVQGATAVLSQFVGLEIGKGYKLVVDAGVFEDMAGNINSPVDGDVPGAGYVLRTPVVGSFVGPRPVSTWPEAGARSVPLSSIVRVTFNEVVQQGVGGVQIGQDAISISDCHFHNKAMTCMPASIMEADTAYDVTFSSGAVLAVSGTPAARSSYQFTTIDYDYVAPVLILPTLQERSAGIPRSAVLTLTFSEIVQAGTGNVVISDCTPGVRGLCYDGLLETEADIATFDISVTQHSQDYALYYDGPRVYIDHPDFVSGAWYSIATSTNGVFQDTSGQFLAKITTGFDFKVVEDDLSNPVVYQTYPIRDDLSQAYAPNTDITLYFSEAIQQSAAEAYVIVSDGIVRNTIPIDNSDPSQGSVTVRGNIVRINPFSDFNYGKTAEVQVQAGAFTDMAGRPFAGIRYQYLVQSFHFEQIKEDNVSVPFSGREGPIMYYTASKLMLYGGRDSAGCRRDLWTSTTGAVWTPVNGVNVTDQHLKALPWSCSPVLPTSGGTDSEKCENGNRLNNGQEYMYNAGATSTQAGACGIIGCGCCRRPAAPRAAHAPTAIDKDGCIWLLGGDCNQDHTHIWKTCSAGQTWMRLPLPSVVPVARHMIGALPSTWVGHAIAIVGGWQLVIVDAGSMQSGCVWKSLDIQVKHLQCVASAPLPFGVRRDPHLMTTSDSRLFLLGGNLCEDRFCSNNKIMLDLWVSPNVGATWHCQTMNFAPAHPLLTSKYSLGIGRYASALMTYDNTIFLMAGLKANTTRGSNFVFTSAAGELDQVFLAPYLKTPESPSVPRSGVAATIYFRENVQMGTGSIRILDRGVDNQPGGFGLAADTDVPVKVSILRQVVSIEPEVMFTPGRNYRVELPKGSLTDISGNVQQQNIVYDFTASTDATAPKVSSMLPLGTRVSPWTSVRLTMTEPVVVGSGSLVLAPSCSNSAIGACVNVSISSSSAIIQGSIAFFGLPLDEKLLYGVTYKLLVPEGLFVDLGGNDVEAAESTFTCVENETDAAGPVQYLASPEADAGDVPGSLSKIDLYFSEQIHVGTGQVTVSDVRGVTANVNVPLQESMVDGAKLSIPVTRGTLNAGGPYAVQIPVGLIKGASGHSFAGINGSQHIFVTKNADLVKPVLVSQAPLHEFLSSFQLPVTTSFMLTFNEPMQAGAGDGPDSDIIFTPRYASTPIHIPAKSSTIKEKKVIIMPPDALMPGEIYSITIGGAAFCDLEFNFYEGLSGGYTISTAPFMKFVQAPGIHWSKQFNGERYAMGAAIGPGNIIFIAGGHRGDGVFEDTYLNDVWKLETQRETNCASALLPPAACSLQECTMGSHGPNLGTREVKKTVWRAPSAGSARCLAEDGTPRSRLDDTMMSSSEECPCPICVSGPGGDLPTDMVNNSYVSEYTFVSAMSETRPLLCREGYVASGPFVCVADTPFLGTFQTPYPTCEAAPCAEPPAYDDVEKFAEFVPENSTDQLNCAALSEEKPMPHQGLCAMKCQAGWKSQTGVFKCDNGRFTPPVCEEQMCNASDTSIENSVADCGPTDLVKFGETCVAKCNAGYLLVMSSQQTPKTNQVSLVCAAISSEPESPPKLQYPAQNGTTVCWANACDLFSGNATGAIIDYPEDMTLGASAAVSCESGYVHLGIDEIRCLPVFDAPGYSGVAWKNISGATVIRLCRPLQCDMPTDPHGLYTHISGSGASAIWKLRCTPGWRSPSRDLHARCSESEALTKPEECLFTGGCNSSQLILGTNVNGTNCRAWMDEGETCTVTCSQGHPVGQFTCVMMEVAGESLCAEKGADTSSVTKMAGAFNMVADLPADSNIQGATFQNLVKGSLAEGLGLWPSDFSRFSIEHNGNEQSRRLRRLLVMSFDISYELIVRDLAKLGQLQRDLASLGAKGSVVTTSFQRSLLAQGCQVTSLKVLRAPTPFQGTILVPATKQKKSAMAAAVTNQEASLNTSTIAGGFVGAMVGLTLITIVLYVLTHLKKNKATM